MQRGWYKSVHPMISTSGMMPGQISSASTSPPAPPAEKQTKAGGWQGTGPDDLMGRSVLMTIVDCISF